MKSEKCRVILAMMVGISFVVGVCGCADPAAFTDPIIYGRGGMSPNAEVMRTNGYTDLFIRQQLSGEKPAPHPTWKAFWQDRYQRYRKYSTTPEVAQREIDYAHLALQRAGLPTYDQ